MGSFGRVQILCLFVDNQARTLVYVDKNRDLIINQLKTQTRITDVYMANSTLDFGYFK